MCWVSLCKMEGKNRVKMLINKLWKTALIQAESGIAMHDADFAGIRPDVGKMYLITRVFSYPQHIVYSAVLLCINPGSFIRQLFIFCGEIARRGWH